MEEQMTKVNLLESIETHRQELEGTLAEIPVDQMTSPGVIGEWTVKDVLAHLTIWERRMTRWLRETAQDQEPRMLPTGMTWDDLDLWNEQTYLENRDRSLDDVLADFQASYPQALQIVTTFPEKDLLDPDRYVWRAGRPLWHIVAANTFWHYDEHNQSLRTWLASL